LPCCGWNYNGYCEQPTNTWCQAMKSQCLTCNGQWYTNGSGGPAPTPSPTGRGLSCCSRGEFSTCPAWVATTSDPCHLYQSSCEGPCGGTWISN
jgi:hypothetical protein